MPAYNPPVVPDLTVVEEPQFQRDEELGRMARDWDDHVEYVRVNHALRERTEPVVPFDQTKLDICRQLILTYDNDYPYLAQQMNSYMWFVTSRVENGQAIPIYEIGLYERGYQGEFDSLTCTYIFELHAQHVDMFGYSRKIPELDNTKRRIPHAL
jgi:hypothetical protein